MRRSMILSMVLMAACAKRAPQAEMYYAEPAPMADYDYREYEAAEDLVGASAGAEKGKMAERPTPRRAAAPAAPPPPPPAPGEPPAPEATAEPEKPVRMVHYTGWAQLRVTRVQETLDAVAKLALSRGGRVERLTADTITVRVPVATFDDSWKEALKLGDVLDQSISAQDVTDQFLAVDLRVKTLTVTRDRLVALLAKAETEEEKIAILRELQRVTEQLDVYESQLRTLRGLADFSTITVQVVPREAVGAQQGPDVAGFEWIRALSPFRRDVWDDKRVTLTTPDGMVVLAEKGPFVAESPEGVVLWTQRLPNEPRADAAFWADAIEDRLHAEFASVNQEKLGDWQCVELLDGSEAPYTWELCVRVDPEDKSLHLGQFWFPDAAAKARYEATIEAAFRGGSS